jgi:hypothetical protein
VCGGCEGIILEVGGGYPSSTALFLSLKDFANWPASWSLSLSLSLSRSLPICSPFPFQLEEVREEAGRREIYRPLSSVEKESEREQKGNKGTLAGTQH